MLKLSDKDLLLITGGQTLACLAIEAVGLTGLLRETPGLFQELHTNGTNANEVIVGFMNVCDLTRVEVLNGVKP